MNKVNKAYVEQNKARRGCAASATKHTAVAKQPLIIYDCDPGVDDALTLCLGSSLLSHSMVVISSYGCSSIAHTTRNAHRLLDLMGRKDVPVIRGSAHPLGWPHPIVGRNMPIFFGQNGLNDVTLPVSKGASVVRPHHDDFVEHVAEILRKACSVDYYLTGPCTNLARVGLRYPELLRDKISRLFIMGGALGHGNAGAKDEATDPGVCEFNFYLDPLATHIVLSLGLTPRVVAWDQAKSFNLSKSTVDGLHGKHPATQHLLKALKNFFVVHTRDTVTAEEHQAEPFVILSDPIVLLTEHSVGKLVKKRLQIVIHGEQMGRSMEHPEGHEVEWFEFADSEAAMSILLDGIGAEVG